MLFTELGMNLPPASWGVSVARILVPSSLESALQRLNDAACHPTLRFIPAACCGVFSLDFIKVTGNEVTLAYTCHSYRKGFRRNGWELCLTVEYGGQYWTIGRTRTFELAFSLVI